MHHARGFVLFGLMVVTAWITTVMLFGMNTQQAQQLLNRDAAERTAYLKEAAQALRAWYRANQATVDAAAAALDTNAALTAAGVTPRYRLRVASSVRLIQGEVSYHDLVLWLPEAEPDASVFVAATGAFAPAAGVAFVRVSGQEIQAMALRDTRRILAETAEALEHYFAARARVAGEEVRVNYFRPDNLCAPPPDAMPCIDAYLTADRVNWAGVGIDGITQRDAWGSLIEVSNLADSTTGAPPFSMAIRATAPWGTVILAQAVQRL